MSTETKSIEVRREEAKSPTALPVGLTEFNEWADDIIELSGAPNNDSVKFTLATMIFHAPSDASDIPKDHFVRMLRKSMSNQVASAVIQDLKAKQQAEIAAASNVTPISSN